MNAAFDPRDVQGLLQTGYGSLKEASYVLLRVRNATAARAWLRSAPITPGIDKSTTAGRKALARTAVQVAFSAAGLRELGASASVVNGFSAEFLAGMSEDSRSRRLGDTGENAPSRWSWGYSRALPHLVVIFFAEPHGLDGLVQQSKQKGWNEAFEELRWLDTANLDGVEPFGFADGISQPKLDWEQKRETTRPQLDYSNVVALGEFVLGYRNEYDKYTDRPVVDADSASADLLAAEDAPEKKDVGRNGTYLVFRDLQQDVRSFWSFLHRQSGGNAAEAEKLAAAFVGRTMAGDPLVPAHEQSIPGIGPGDDEIRKNRFTFDRDPSGTACPFGAHVHRANPRNSDYPGHPTGMTRLLPMIGFGPRGFRDDLMSSVRFHRILRRGREYGPELLPEDALAPAPPDEPERGLHFICLNANISRQFEFLQNAWMMNTKFSGLTGESDPLIGNRAAIPGCPVTHEFTFPREDGPPRRVSGLPQFVTVRGGAYFFLPGIRALQYFARD